MLNVKLIPETNIVDVGIDTTAGYGEVEWLRSELDALIATRGKLRVLLVTTNIRDDAAFACWERMKLDLDVLHGVERLAAVTDKAWFRSMIEIIDPLFETRIKCFEPGEREAALRTLTS